MTGRNHATEIAFAIEPPGMPRPRAALALERLRAKLSELSGPPGPPAALAAQAALAPPAPLNPLNPLINSLRSAREVGRAVREAAAAGGATAAPIATSVPALDELLAGGLPRGQLVELIGARSSGRFSAVLAAVAAATMAGEATALVDLGDGLDPQAAAALGVDLRRLLWLRPRTLKQALAGTEILIGGGFPLVALDLGNPPLRGGRGAEAAWLRLARAARAHGAALVVASPYRLSGTAAAIVLQAARGRVRWQGGQGLSGRPLCRLLDGLSCQLALEKCRGRALPARSLGLELRVMPPGESAPGESALGESAPAESALREGAPSPSPRVAPTPEALPAIAQGGRRRPRRS
jgi:recA bacterial DNA recombination protein